MNAKTYQYKIYGIIAVTIILVLVCLFFIYPKTDLKNAESAELLKQKRQEQADLIAEQQSYEAGKRDLQTLDEKTVKPEDLFSQDTKVVKEIKILEAYASERDLEFELQIAGSVDEANKLPGTIAKLVTIPYTMVVEGDFVNMVKFIETTQNAPFITSIDEVTMSGLADGRVRATLSALFYIKP